MSLQEVSFTLNWNGDPALYPPLPILIVDEHLNEIRRLTISTARPCQEEFETDDRRFFALLRLPNGTSIVKPFDTDGKRHYSIEFEVGTESPHEWMAWSAMRVDLRRDIAPLMDDLGMHRAWIQLWELDREKRRWLQMELPEQEIDHGREAVQVELTRSLRPRALLAYLGAGSPQVIALPANQRLRVLLTRAHAIPTSHAPRVLVGGYGAAAEGLLEFMRKGSLGLAGTALDPGSELAQQVLYDKVENPLAATAAAYYLLRKRDWDRLPQQWLENLAEWFSFIPDATLLRDASVIQRGMSSKDAPALAAKSLQTALGHGLPIFAEAAALMTDLLFYAEQARGADALTRAQRKLLHGMLAGFQPAGLTFGFFGDAPEQPIAAYEVHRANRAITIERRLRQIGSEVFDTGALVGLLGPIGLQDVSRRFEFAVKAIETAIGTFGGGQPIVLGNARQTLFIKDLYSSSELLAQSLESPAEPVARSPDRFT